MTDDVAIELISRATPPWMNFRLKNLPKKKLKKLAQCWKYKFYFAKCKPDLIFTITSTYFPMTNIRNTKLNVEKCWVAVAKFR